MIYYILTGQVQGDYLFHQYQELLSAKKFDVHARHLTSDRTLLFFLFYFFQDDDEEDAEEEFALAKKEKSLKYMMMEDSGNIKSLLCIFHPLHSMRVFSFFV